MLEEFQADVLLTFDNAMLYNEEGSIVHHMAKEMKTTFGRVNNKPFTTLLLMWFIFLHTLYT